MPPELPDKSAPKAALEKRFESLQTEAENLQELKDKEGDFDDYAEQLMTFMDEWGRLWKDIESAQESIRTELEALRRAPDSVELRNYRFELSKIPGELQELRYETSHLITYPQTRSLLYEKFMSQTFDGVEVTSESGETRTSESKAVYDAAMELLRNSTIDPYYLSFIIRAAGIEGAKAIDADGVERMWAPLSSGSDTDLTETVEEDRDWMKEHPDAAVRYLDINLLSFEKGLFGSSNDRPYEMLEDFLHKVDTYDLINAVPKEQRESYRNQVEKWREERSKME